MSVKFDCPQCGRKLTVDAAHSGKTVRCPSCKATVKVPASEPAPLSLDDAQSLPPKKDEGFRFESGEPERDERESGDEEEEYRPRSTQRKSKWNDIASGIGPVQFGLIVLAIAATMLIVTPHFISIRQDGASARRMLMNLFIICFLMAVGSSACFCFGRMAGGKIPDPRSKKLSTWSLAVCGLSILIWMVYLGFLIYLRMQHEKITDPVTMVRVLLIILALAVLAMWGAELIFLGLLMRVAWVFDESKLFLWAKAVFIALVVLLAVFLLFVGYLIIQIDREIRVGNMDLDTFKIIAHTAYAITLGFLACYFCTLILGKRVLYGGTANEERMHEDDDRDRRRRRRDDSRDDDDDDRPSRRRERRD